MTTISDLVPTAVLLGIAQRVRQKAFDIATTKNVPIRSVGEIVIDPPKTTQAQTAVNLRFSNNRISAFEWGSGIHRKRGTPSTYLIVPDKKRALWFPYPEGSIYPGVVKYTKNGVVGITTQAVQHPGVAPRPFLEPAKRQTRKQNLEDIRKTNLANTKLIIRGMGRKI